MNQTRTATIRDVAHASGLRSTVSRVLSSVRQIVISRRRVSGVSARELGYRPHPGARHWYKNLPVGLIVPRSRTRGSPR
jgi:DNA-binding LacI/PurR family transcriptional regulator